MKKFSKFLLSLIVVTGLFLPMGASAYTIDQTYNQVRDTTWTANKYITLHETGTYAPAVNNAIYFNREWANAGTYTSFIVGDGGKVYQVSPAGRVQWGAGSEANYNSPAQIELSRTTDKTTFQKDYPVYVNLARDMAIKYSIPLTLDGSGNGIKSHLWFTLNFWGDHTDPYDYLASWGISKAQLQADLLTGLKEDGTSVTPTPTQPVKPVQPNQGYSVESWNIPQSVDVSALNIRTAQNTNAQAIGTLTAGQTFNATRVTKNGESIDGYSTWFEVNGTGWVSGAYVTPTQSVQPSIENRTSHSGTFTVDRRLPVSADTDPHSPEVAAYNAGQSVSYDSYTTSNGYVWISYIASSGNRRYIAVGPNDGNVGTTWGTGFFN